MPELDFELKSRKGKSIDYWFEKIIPVEEDGFTGYNGKIVIELYTKFELEINYKINMTHLGLDEEYFSNSNSKVPEFAIDTIITLDRLGALEKLNDENFDEFNAVQTTYEKSKQKFSELTFKDLTQNYAYTLVFWNGNLVYGDPKDDSCVEDLCAFKGKYDNKKVFEIHTKVVDCLHCAIAVDGEE